jgi:hypothetical protein
MKSIVLCILLTIIGCDLFAADNVNIVSNGKFFKLSTDNKMIDGKSIDIKFKIDLDSQYAVIGNKLLTIISVNGNDVVAVIDMRNFTLDRVLLSDMSNILNSDIKIVSRPNSTDCLIMYTDVSEVDKSILVDMNSFLLKDVSSQFPDKDSFVGFYPDGSKYAMISENDCLAVVTVDVSTGNSINEVCLSGKIGTGLPWKIKNTNDSQVLISVSDSYAGGDNYIENHNFTSGQLITTVRIGKGAVNYSSFISGGFIVNTGVINVIDRESDIVEVTYGQNISKYDNSGKLVKDIILDGDVVGNIYYNKDTDKLYAISRDLATSTYALNIIDSKAITLISKTTGLSNDLRLYLQ